MNVEPIEEKTRKYIEEMESGDLCPDGAPASSPVMVTSREEIIAGCKRFLSGNPAYILSAGLLLYSISLISGDPKFLNGETLKLAFNFSALQVYELMLVVTAVFLARREVWYDSTLLVFLENLLVFVPFILVSQAIFIGPAYTWTICLAGGLLAASRFAGLKRHFRQLNFPAPLIRLGLLFLALHLFSPMVLRAIYQEGDPRTSEPLFAAILAGAWQWLMPVLAALALSLPREGAKGVRAPERPWLPLLFFGLWVGATGVHLSAIGYVYSIKWQWLWLAPSLWTLAWIAYVRRLDFLQETHKTLSQLVLALPVMSTALAFTQPHRPVFLVLSVLNTAIYMGFWRRDRSNRLALELWLYSLVSSIIGVCYASPSSIFIANSDTLWRAGLVAFAISQALIFRDPRMGFVGAVGTAMATGYAVGNWNLPGHWAAQAGLVFFILHSLAWRADLPNGNKACLNLAATAWLADIWIWLAAGGGTAAWQGASIGLVLLAAYALARWIRGYWGPRIIPVVAVIALLSTQAYYAVVLFKSAPSGLIMLAASFLLFGIGTGIAWSKPRW